MADESAKLIEALELIEDVSSTNVKDWTDSILSTMYNQAINKTAKPVYTCAFKCRRPKQVMIASLPELGTFLKPVVKAAIPKCTPSHFGRGDELVYDESVRKSVEHKLQKNDDLHEYILRAATKTAVQIFGSLVKLTADKLVIYSAGGKFSKHRDSIASAEHIGTVVVQLPIDCEGGQLLLNNVVAAPVTKKKSYYSTDYSSSEHYYDTEDYDSATYRYSERKTYPYLIATAFYTDVEHHVTPVISGHRVTVTFKVERSAVPVALDDWDTAKIRVSEPTRVTGDGYNLEVERSYRDETLESDESALALQPFVDSLQSFNNQPIVIGCRHMIPRAALDIDGLRGVDKTVALKLIAAGYTVTPVLVTVEKIEGMEDSEANYTRIFVCDIPKGTKPIFVRPFDDYEALVLEAGERHVQHIGNQPGEVEALRYISAALLVVK